MGPDDFLATHGSEVLKSLIDEALPADPVARISVIIQQSDNDPTTKVAALLGSTDF